MKFAQFEDWMVWHILWKFQIREQSSVLNVVNHTALETKVWLCNSHIKGVSYKELNVKGITTNDLDFRLLEPQDCYEILNTYGKTTSGEYWIYPIITATSARTPMRVWCDMDTDGGGWTVSWGFDKRIRIYLWRRQRKIPRKIKFRKRFINIRVGGIENADGCTWCRYCYLHQKEGSKA